MHRLETLKGRLSASAIAKYLVVPGMGEPRNEPQPMSVDTRWGRRDE